MFVIQAKRRGGRWETIDEAETYEEAWRKYGEHRVELGPEYMMVLAPKAK